MFGHLEFYFGKYVRLECNPIPASISGMFQFKGSALISKINETIKCCKPSLKMASSGTSPYPEIWNKKSNVYEQLENGKRLDRPDNCSRDCYAVMRSCWEWDEKERKTFYELYDLLQRLLDRYLRENHDFMRAYQPQGWAWYWP